MRRWGAEGASAAKAAPLRALAVGADACSDQDWCREEVVPSLFEHVRKDVSGKEDEATRLHTAISMLDCLKDEGDIESLTDDVLAGLVQVAPGQRHPALPAGGSCDETSVCEDIRLWKDWANRSCGDYASLGWCAGGKVLNTSSGEFDSAARTSCCVCGGYDPSPDWDECQVLQNKGCTNEEESKEVKLKSGSNASCTQACRDDPRCTGGHFNEESMKCLLFGVEGATADKTCQEVVTTNTSRIFCRYLPDDTKCAAGTSCRLDGSGGKKCEGGFEVVAEGDCEKNCKFTCRMPRNYSKSYVPEAAVKLLNDWRPTAEFVLCNQNDTEERDWVRESCADMCATCNLERMPNKDDAMRVLLGCSDEQYEDWVGADCSWYAVWPHTSGAKQTCAKYADDETMQKCRRTCSTCPYERYLSDAFDVNSNGKMDLTELNAMMVSIDDVIMNKRSWPDDDLPCAVSSPGVRYDYEIDLDCLWGDPLSAEFRNDLATKASELLTLKQKPDLYLGDGDVPHRFDAPLMIDGGSNFALQREDPFDVFRECRADADCQGWTVRACGDFKAENRFCQRHLAVPMYCSPLCRTGGCGPSGSVFPGGGGRYCQPCDACFIEEGDRGGLGPCPAWCAGYSAAGSASVSSASPDAVGWEENDLPGTFTLSAWVRGFDTQLMFQKNIRLSGGNLSGHAGYDVRTGMLVCWELSPFEVKFRNRWDEREMTTVKNPLAHMVRKDAWDFIVLKKASRTDATGNRLEELTWMVNGVNAGTSETIEGMDTVPAWGFPDCGGQLLSTTVAMQMTYEGPDSEGAPGTEKIQSAGSEQEQQAVPWASGKYGMTALTFEKVNIPKNASIKSARLEICAAPSFGEGFLKQWRCDGETNNKLVKMKIAGLTASFDSIHHGESSCTVANLTNKSRTSSEVEWEVRISEWSSSGLAGLETVGGCTVVTPDVTSIVRELLSESKRNSSFDLSFVFADAQKPWGACPLTSLFDNITELMIAADEERLEGDMCSLGKVSIDAVNDAIPLWGVPRAQATAPTRLVLTYCLNEDCVSPAFLGAGGSAGLTETGSARRMSKVRGRPPSAEPGRSRSRTGRLAGHIPRQSSSARGHSAGSGSGLVGRRARPLEVQPPPRPSFSGGPRPALEARPRRLQSLDSAVQACTGRTCMEVGKTPVAGMSTNGLLLNPRFTFRSMPVSELQDMYYNDLRFIRPVNEEELVGPKRFVERPEATLAQYPVEVVSIIPPVVFQTRSKLVDCSELTSSMAPSLENYFRSQVERKCNATYNCSAQSGFACVDRAQPVKDTHLGIKPIEYEDAAWFPAFLELFTVPTIFRDGIVKTRDLLDLQTSEITLVNIFFSPGTNAGTILRVRWAITGPGKIASTTEIQSIKQMPPDHRNVWTGVVVVFMILNMADIIVLAITFVSRWVQRMKVVKAMPGASDDLKGRVADTYGLLEDTDVCDLLLRVSLFCFTYWHTEVYEGPERKMVEGTMRDVELFEGVFQSILGLAWASNELSTEEKVSKFLDLVVDFDELIRKEGQHRFIARFFLLFFFVRLVIYTRVHPRIAVLYGTIMEMCADFIHFLAIFSTLYVILAFLGCWGFGDHDPNYADFGVTLYTLFRMVCGEFNLPDGVNAGFKVGYAIYSIVYFLVVFSLLLNFFLAIVVDSYQGAKEHVMECKVDYSVVWDLYYSYAYPITAWRYGWPQRGQLLKKLVKTNFGKHDEEYEDEVPVSSLELVQFGVLGDLESAEGLMIYYNHVCPHVNQAFTNRQSTLDHKMRLTKLKAADSVLDSYQKETEQQKSHDDEQAGDDSHQTRGRASQRSGWPHHSQSLGRASTGDPTRHLHGRRAHMRKTALNHTPHFEDQVALGALEVREAASEERLGRLEEHQGQLLQLAQQMAGKASEAREAREATSEERLGRLEEQQGQILRLAQQLLAGGAAAAAAPGGNDEAAGGRAALEALEAHAAASEERLGRLENQQGQILQLVEQLASAPRRIGSEPALPAGRAKQEVGDSRAMNPPKSSRRKVVKPKTQEFKEKDDMSAAD